MALFKTPEKETRDKMWNDYFKNPSQDNRNILIEEYAPLVKVVAGRMNLQFGFAVEFDDLVSYGIFGLIDAVSKFNPELNVKFETYASLRIRGTILDQLRKFDWAPREARSKQKEWNEAVAKVMLKKGNSYQAEDVRKELNLNEEDFAKFCDKINIMDVISMDEYMDNGSDIGEINNNYSPEKMAERKNLKELIVNALDSLTEKQKQVVTLSYYEELTQKEIANVMNVTESRVSQLHSAAMAQLKIRLGNNVKLFLYI